ncbi:MAG TPA: hypothetical protein VD963_09245 [Phycisphaerales bacterium]|nr:hypothetical protein [Phycisphaerales bacterium]
MPDTPRQDRPPAQRWALIAIIIVGFTVLGWQVRSTFFPPRPAAPRLSAEDEALRREYEQLAPPEEEEDAGAPSEEELIKPEGRGPVRSDE